MWQGVRFHLEVRPLLHLAVSLGAPLKLPSHCMQCQHPKEPEKPEELPGCGQFSTANSTFSSFTKSASQSISGLQPLSSSSDVLCLCALSHSRAVSLSARPCNLQHLTFAALHCLLLPVFAWYFNLSKISVSAGIYFEQQFPQQQNRRL